MSQSACKNTVPTGESMQLRCASFNVLADQYLHYGDYTHAAPDLLVPGARLPYTLGLIDKLQADVIALQEAELPLVNAFEASGKWQLFWSPNDDNESVGCLTVVRPGIHTIDLGTHVYGNGSGHVMQMIAISGVIFVNTHIKYARLDDPDHAGVFQTRELLKRVGSVQPAVIFADCNDRPGGPVRALIENAGFIDTCGGIATALIGEERAAIDMVAVRGVNAQRIETHISLEGIPSVDCPSDHLPVMAWIDIG